MSGFQSPNFTQTPNDLFDELLPEMGLAELKVILCIVRHTFGYHLENVKLSIRAIARFTGMSAKSVMEGAQKGEEHGLIKRIQDGNKTTEWKAVVSVLPSSTPRITRYHAGVLPSNTLVGIKERKKEKKGDLVDGILYYGNLAKEKGEDKVEELIQKLEHGLHLNISRSLSNQQAAKRILKDGRSVDKWLEWCKSDEWRLERLYMYANLDRVWQDFPQAFREDNGRNPQGLEVGI